MLGSHREPSLWPWPRDVTGLWLLATRLIPNDKQKPVHVVEVVRRLVPVLDVWRLTEPDLTCPSLWLFPLSTTFCHSQSMTWLVLAIWSATVLFFFKHVSTRRRTAWATTTLWQLFTWNLKTKQIITKTYLYNFDSLKPHLYIVMLGLIGVDIIFHISA